MDQVHDNNNNIYINGNKIINKFYFLFLRLKTCGSNKMDYDYNITSNNNLRIYGT